MSENNIRQTNFGFGNKQIIKISGKEEISQKDLRKEPIKKILILSASPINLDRLRFDEEIREIEEGLRRAKYRNLFEIKCRPALRFQDLRRVLLDFEPQIIHFIGHGNMNGLKLEDKLGNEALIPTDVLSELFELFSDQIECVVLSSCHSVVQTNALNRYIPYVIGMLDKIMDKAAIAFAVGFYDALGSGKSIEKAFAFGCNAIHQVYPDFPAHLIPVLKTGGK